MMITLTDGKEYEVAHTFSEGRVLINFDGLYAFADRAGDGTWDLSGEPARDDEKPVLAALLAPTMDQSILTVTSRLGEQSEEVSDATVTKDGE